MNQTLLLLTTLAATFLVLTACTTRDRVLLRIDETLAQLDNASNDWQQLMRDLSNDVRKLEAQTALDIDAIAQRGIARTGVEFRCNVDFIRNRVKEDLARFAATLRGNTPTLLEPKFCNILFAPPQAEQASVNMAALPNEVLFYGYNFDAGSSSPVEVVMKHSGGEVSFNALNQVASPTHYLLAVNTAATGGGRNMCNLESRQIQLRWQGKVLSSVNVIPAKCPAAPATPAPVIQSVTFPDTVHGKFIGGFGLDKRYGGACTEGFTRVSFNVRQSGGQGGGTCDSGTWASPDDTASCEVAVHYSIPASAPNPIPNSASCEIVISEHQNAAPPPPPPPCPCR